jgi:hypothetical protein
MLIIRREQVEVFRRAAVQRFERDLVADLWRAHPTRYAEFGDNAVLKLVREAVRRLAVYGIADEDDVANLAELDFTLGQPFERQKGQEWAGEILRDQTIIPGARVALILARQSRTGPTTT